jgi:hypothetical protein
MQRHTNIGPGNESWSREISHEPFSNESLLSAIRDAIERSRVKLDSETEIRALRARFAAPTRFERQVTTLLIFGMLNKQVGCETGMCAAEIARSELSLAFPEIVPPATCARQGLPVTSDAHDLPTNAVFKNLRTISESSATRFPRRNYRHASKAIGLADHQ